MKELSKMKVQALLAGVLFPVLLGALAAIGCGADHEPHGPDAHSGNHIESDNHRSHDSHKSPLELNDGKRWQADSSTNASIKKMQKITAEYSNDPSMAARDLQTQFKTLLKECTMKGPAHEQLHAYLGPLQTRIHGLKECKENCQPRIDDLSDYLKSYSDYFE